MDLLCVSCWLSTSYSVKHLLVRCCPAALIAYSPPSSADGLQYRNDCITEHRSRITHCTMHNANQLVQSKTRPVACLILLAACQNEMGERQSKLRAGCVSALSRSPPQHLQSGKRVLQQLLGPTTDWFTTQRTFVVIMEFPCHYCNSNTCACSGQTQRRIAPAGFEHASSATQPVISSP